jgi:predicted transcriptional regulator
MNDSSNLLPGQPPSGEPEVRNRTLDLVVLPPAQNQIMRLVLRKSELTNQQIWELIQDLPESERLSHDDFDSALTTLCAQQLLSRNGDGPTATYKASMQRMAARPKAARIWSALEAASTAPAPIPPPAPTPGSNETSDRRARASRFWDLMGKPDETPGAGDRTDEKHD